MEKLQEARRNCVEQLAMLRQFRKNEEGGLIILTLLLLISMLVVGGMAVDFMRFEAERTKLQSVSDRAVLDAANLNQQRDASDVMTDFFKAEGYDGAIVGVPEVEKNATGSTVTLNSQIEMNTFFLRLIGMDTLTAPASASAIQGTGNVEVSLILDISGSMRTNMTGPVYQFNEDGTYKVDEDTGELATQEETHSRMFFLQQAAKKFVSDLLLEDYKDRVSINLVAYSQHVRLRDDLYFALKTTPDTISDENELDSSFGSIEDGYALPFDWQALDAEGNPAKDKDGNPIYNVDQDGNPILPSAPFAWPDDTEYFTNPSRCVTFTDAEYETLTFDTDRVYTQVELVDFYSNNTWFRTGYEPCPANPYQGIILLSQDVDELHAAIDQFEPTLNTSIHRGMKWGVSLLDPSMRELIGTIPTIDPAFRGTRPADYGSGTTSKYVVIMTDGQTVSSRRVRRDDEPEYGDNNDFYDTYEERLGFSKYSGRYYANNDGNGSTSFWNMTTSIGDESELNTDLKQLCDLARPVMTEVYTISLGVQNTTMTDCASKPSNAFRTAITNDEDEPGMQEIFKKISDQITALRLSL